MSKSSDLDRKVNLYILDCIESEDAELKTAQDKIDYCKARFESEADWNIERVGRLKACTDWLQGLAIDIAFYDNDILKLAKDWGALDENATERQEDALIENYWHFMADNLCQMFDGYRVPRG